MYNAYDALDIFITNLNSSKKISSISVNVQIGSGLSPSSEVEWSYNGYENFKKLLRERGLDEKIKINQGTIGPADESGRILKGSSLNVKIN